MKSQIPYVNLIKQIKQEKKEIFKSFNKIFKKGEFILGDEVDKFEKNISKFLNIKYCVALNSGTDAITLGLHLLGVKRNDEVITPPNSFIASTAAIVHLGAKPVFADVKYNQNIDPKEIEKKININTRAIMPVHLSGLPCQMDQILKISKKYKIPVIEDAAQAIGSKYKKKFVGTFGEVGCFSAHPLKNLNAIGDAGYLVTNNKNIAHQAKLLRNHGIHKRNKILTFGYVSRMDNIQATVLNYRFKSLNKVVRKRRNNAALYFKLLKKLKDVTLPNYDKNKFHTFHTFVVKVNKRDKLKKFLLSKGIISSIHYPYLIFEQEAFKKKYGKINKSDYPTSAKLSKEILTLPVNQFLSHRDIRIICKNIKEFFSK